jgi:hypothetical protein
VTHSNGLATRSAGNQVLAAQWCAGSMMVGVATLLALYFSGVDPHGVAAVMPLHLVLTGVGGYSIGDALRHGDYFRPRVVARLTYFVLYVMSLPILAFDTDALASVAVVSHDLGSCIDRAQTAQLVALGGLVGLLMGEGIASRAAKPSREHARRLRKERFLLVGLPILLIAMAANATICGGWMEYLRKMPQFYLRSEEWERFSDEGGFLVSQAVRWLPVSVLVLSWGFVRSREVGRVGSIAWLLGGSILNLFLSSATGGRGIGLTTLFYSVIVFNCAIHRFKTGTLLLLLALIASGAFVQGLARGVGRTNESITMEQISERLTDNKFQTFWLSYLTNDLRLLQVVDTVQQKGVANGRTISEPLTSLVEGRPAITTGVELHRNESEDMRSAAARYGLLSDGYYNFGFLGSSVALILAGALVGVLDRAYQRASADVNVAGATTVCWTAFTANFVVAANFHSLPKYFLLASLPVYVISLTLRRQARKRCRPIWSFQRFLPDCRQPRIQLEHLEPPPRQRQRWNRHPR